MAVIGSRIVVALAAVLALLLAVEISIVVIVGYSNRGIWDVVRPSLISGVFIVMALGMISYLIKKVWNPRKAKKTEGEQPD